MHKETRNKLIVNIIIGFVIGVIYGIPSSNIWGFITSIMVFFILGVIYGLIARSIELLTKKANVFLRLFLRPFLKLFTVYAAIYIFLKYFIKNREAIYRVFQYGHLDPWSFDLYSVLIFGLIPVAYLLVSIIYNLIIEMRKKNQAKG